MNNLTKFHIQPLFGDEANGNYKAPHSFGAIWGLPLRGALKKHDDIENAPGYSWQTSASDQVVFEGDLDETCRRIDAEFSHDIFAVYTYSLVTDVQPVSDFPVVECFTNQL